MTELTVEQIAAALTGQLGDQLSEVRLLMLFKSRAATRKDPEAEARHELPKAA
jgi:hypothetical protein